MDWTNTKRDAAGVDLQTWLNQVIDEYPKTSQLAAALLGPLDFLSMGAFGSSNLRGSYPVTYRLGQASVPVSAAAMNRGLPPAFLTPHILSAITGDPYVHGPLMSLWENHLAKNAPHEVPSPTLSDALRIAGLPNALATGADYGSRRE